MSNDSLLEMENALSKRSLILISIITGAIILLVFIISITTLAKPGCTIDITQDFTDFHPLLLQLNSPEFIVPKNCPNIFLYVDESVRLACPGKNNHLSVNTAQETTVTCVSNKIFRVNYNNTGEKLFKELRCAQYPEPIALRTGQKCSGKYTEVQIGFEAIKGFVPVMTNCFDETKKDSLYSIYHLSSQIKSQQKSQRPNSFEESDFYQDIRKPTKLYEKTSQRTTFKQILGSSDLANKYISQDTDYYLSRGHLSAKADFIYGSQQRATFFYINVAPQWQTFNGNNWKKIEESCRDFASKRNLNLIVYTGIYGQSTLPDVNNKKQKLALYIDKNNKQFINVPEIYWKILYDPESKKGIALIGHNNPYDENVTKFLCNDVSDKLNWVFWDAKNVTAGFSYSCEYAEFKKVVEYVPDIPINGLLT